MPLRVLLGLVAAVLLASVFGIWWLSGRSTSEPPPLVPIPSTVPAETSVHESLERDSPDARAVSIAPPTVPVRRANQPAAEFLGFSGPGHIVGHVYSLSDHAPITQATISASWLGDRPSGSSVGPTVGGPDLGGRYEFMGVAVGSWELTCTAKGFERQVKVVQSVEGAAVPSDFALALARPLPIVVHIRCPDGRALADSIDRPGDKDLAFHLRIVCTEVCPSARAELPESARILPSRATSVRPDPRLPEKKVASDDSWFRVDLEHNGTGCCCLVLGKHVLDVAAFDASSKRIDMIVSMDDVRRWTGSVRLRVVDSVTGAAVVPAEVCVRCSTGDRIMGSTDAKGDASIANVIAGESVLEVNSNAYARLTQPVLVRPGIENDLRELKMHHKITVSGRLEWPAEVRLPVPVVWAYLVDQGEETTHPEANNPSFMQSGTFRFEAFDPGIYLVGWEAKSTRPTVSAVRDGKVEGWRYVDARSGDVRGVEIVLTEAMAREMQAATRSDR